MLYMWPAVGAAGAKNVTSSVKDDSNNFLRLHAYFDHVILLRTCINFIYFFKLENSYSGHTTHKVKVNDMYNSQ